MPIQRKRDPNNPEDVREAYEFISTRLNLPKIATNWEELTSQLPPLTPEELEQSEWYRNAADEMARIMRMPSSGGSDCQSNC